MAKELQEIITNNTNESGEVNWENADKAYQDHLNGIITKTVAKETEKVKGETLTTFIKELGIEGQSLDDVKSWVKTMSGNTDEFKELSLKQKKDFEELKEKYDLTTQELNQIKQEAIQTNQLNKIMSAGLDEEQADYVRYTLNKKVDEEHTFDDLLEEWLKENKPKTNNRFQKQNFNSGNGEEVPESIRKRYPKYFDR